MELVFPAISLQADCESQGPGQAHPGGDEMTPLRTYSGDSISGPAGLHDQPLSPPPASAAGGTFTPTRKENRRGRANMQDVQVVGVERERPGPDGLQRGMSLAQSHTHHTRVARKPGSSLPASLLLLDRPPRVASQPTAAAPRNPPPGGFDARAVGHSPA